MDRTPELALFPSGPWVRPFTVGRAALAADLVWLEAIQYYGRHRKTDRLYPYAETLFTTLTGLAPDFENGYILGALILAEDQARFHAARALLESGVRANPGSWRLAFELGFLCYLSGRDQLEAARLLDAASRIQGAPPSVRRLAAFAASRAGDRSTALALWREVLAETDNEEVRRVVEGYITRLEERGAL